MIPPDSDFCQLLQKCLRTYKIMDMIVDLTINKKIIQFINAKVLSGLYQSMNKEAWKNRFRTTVSCALTQFA